MRTLRKYTALACLGVGAWLRAGEPVKWTAAAPAPATTIATSRPAGLLADSNTQVVPVSHTDRLILPPMSEFSAPSPMSSMSSTPQNLPTVQYIDLPKDLEHARPMPSKPSDRTPATGPALEDLKPVDSPNEIMPPPRILDPKPEGSGSAPPPPPVHDLPIVSDDMPVEEGAVAYGRGRFFTPYLYNPDYRLYIKAESLVWWIHPSTYPVLVTTGSPNDQVPSALGQPGTNLVIGGREQQQPVMPGFRLNIGYWFAQDHSVGFEANFLYLGRQTTHQSIASNAAGNPIIGPPVINPFTGQTILLSNPFGGGVARAGAAAADFSSEFWGAEFNFRRNLCEGDCCTWDGILGFRHVGVNESLRLAQTSTLLATGETLAITDRFSTANRFYGPQIGLLGECRWRRFYVDGNFKLALGVNRQTVVIDGLATDSAIPIVVASGSLAQRSNIGQYSRNVFSAVPEIGFHVGMNITENLRVYAGYTLLCWSNVAQPGEQVNGNRANPTFGFHSNTFFAQGADVGLEYRY
jgi:hypothetical protein